MRDFKVIYPPEKEARLLEKARKLREEGLTVDQIAKTFGVLDVEWLADKLGVDGEVTHYKVVEETPKKKTKNVSKYH